MNKRNLAIKISKHPLLREFTEDKTIPNSVIARLIVEELMEAPKGEFYTGKPGELGYNAKRILNKNFNAAKKSGNAENLQKFIKTYSDGKNPYGKFDQIPSETQKVLTKYGSFLITKAEEQIKILQAAEEAKNTPDQEDDDKVKQAQQKLDKEVIAADQEVEKVMAGMAVAGGGKDEKTMLQAIQKKAEDASDYLSYASLGSAGLAVSIPPSAPVTFAASKLAGWAGTAMDVVALGAAIANDDKEGIKANGISVGIGAAVLFVPGGEGWKLIGKDAGKETIKVISKETGQAVAKEVSKQVADQLGKDIAKGVTEQALVAATKKAAIEGATKSIAQSALQQSAKNTYGKIKDQDNFKAKDGTVYTKEQLKALGEKAIYEAGKKIESQVNGKKGAEVNKDIEAAAKEVGLFDRFKEFFGFGGDSEEQKPEQEDIENPFKDLPGYKQLNLKDEQEEVFVGFLKQLKEKGILNEENEQSLTKLSKIIGTGRGLKDIIKSFEGEKRNILIRVLQRPEVQDFIQKNMKQIASTALARQELDIEPIAKKFGEYEYFKPLNDEQKKVMFKFIALLKRNKLFEGLTDKTSLVKALRDLGVKGIPKMEVILQYMTEPEQQAVQRILSNTDTGVDKFLDMLKKAELVPAEKTGEEEKPGEKKKKEPEEIKGDPIDINAKFAPNFVKYANEFLNDFYRKKYRKDQGILLNNLIETLKAIVEDEDLAQAFGRVPDDEEKPKSSDETEEAPVQDEEEQQPISEQEDEGEKVEADKDELRNIRIGLRSFLRRVNKTKQFLKEFTDNAKSVVSTQYKKRFMQNLKEIQESIYRLALVLNKILDNKEELSEKKESETMKLWKEVQKKYNLAAQSVNSIKELVDTETPPNQLDSILTNDTYSALLSLVDYFPSVAPFGQGKQKRSDFKEYERRFNKAIEMVKSDLQNVFNLMKTGEAGEESLQGARSGLKDFADAVASIFGVPSRFEDAKVKPEDSEGPALEGEPGAKEEPEEKKYSDEISEEDKEMITAAINDHKDFYEIATEEYKKLSTALRRPTSQEKPVQEIMKKTEDLIRDLNRSRKLAKSWLKKVQSGQASQKFIDKLERILKSYIDKYDELANAEMRRDFSSVLDTDRKRLEKIRKLLDIARKYVTEKQSIYTIFQSILTGGEYLNAQGNAIDPQPSLKLIRDSLKDADGKESERLTGDMNFKVDRMFSNIKNIFKGQLDLSQADFSGFKNIVGFLADKVSKASIKLRSKINEEPEEDEDIELEPSADDKLRARYENSLEEALKHMKDFVSVYLTFVSAMKKAEENELETLNALDEDFTVVKGQLALMDDRLNKVSIIFGRQISLENMKKFGFPPKGTEKPESTDDDDEQEDTDDEQDQENFDFNNVESIRNTLIYGQNKRRVEELKQLLMDDSAFDGNENLVKEYYEAFLLWYIMLYEREESVQNESFVQKMPQLIKQKIDDKKIDKALKKLRTINPKIYQTVEDFHKGLDPATITTFYKIFSLIFNNQPINIKIDKNFINTFSKKLNPPKKQNNNKNKARQDVQFADTEPASLEEKIAKKLKPLIREILNKGK